MNKFFLFFLLLNSSLFANNCIVLDNLGILKNPLKGYTVVKTLPRDVKEYFKLEKKTSIEKSLIAKIRCFNDSDENYRFKTRLVLKHSSANFRSIVASDWSHLECEDSSFEEVKKARERSLRQASKWIGSCRYSNIMLENYLSR